MKILTFVDLHSNISALKKIIRKSKQADLLLCAGDISLFEKQLDKIFELLTQAKKPVLIIHGNHEEPTTLTKLCKRYKNIVFIHKKIKSFDKAVFIGFGGEGFSLTSKDFEHFIKKKKRELNELKKKNRKLVLITHAPPFGYLDKVDSHHAGNKSFRDFILRFKPLLHICGHFHEHAKKTAMLGKTKIINPGPEGKIIQIA